MLEQSCHPDRDHSLEVRGSNASKSYFANSFAKSSGSLDLQRLYRAAVPQRVLRLPSMYVWRATRAIVKAGKLLYIGYLLIAVMLFRESLLMGIAIILSWRTGSQFP